MKELLTVTQRKFLLVLLVNIATFAMLYVGKMSDSAASNIIAWVTGLYFGANVAQKIGTKSNE